MLMNYIQAIAGLILCLGLVFIVVSLLRRHQDKLEKFFSGRTFIKKDVRRLKTIERLQLAQGHTALILGKDDEEHFVILTPAGVSVVKSTLKAADNG